MPMCVRTLCAANLLKFLTTRFSPSSRGAQVDHCRIIRPVTFLSLTRFSLGAIPWRDPLSQRRA